MRTIIRGLVTGASAIALGLTTCVAAGAAPVAGPERPESTSIDQLPADVLAAMQRDLGLTREQATQRAARQQQAATLSATLQADLGAAFGGSWFDSHSGALVVAVTDAQRVPAVTKAGAYAQVVKHSKASLEAIKAELDGLAGRANDTNVAARTAAHAPQATVAGLTGWYVDLMTNSVAVTVLKGQQPAALAALAKYGDAVRLEYTDRAPTTTVDFMDGGDEINGASCSAGFNLRNPSTGQGYLLTAGHCVSPGQAVTGQGGVFFGTVLESWFPSYDDAIIRADNPGYWIQGPWVDTNPSNGGVIVVTGSSDSPVGTSMCKSGITTKWTCGVITAKDVTVQYGGVPGPVFGLTQHSACVEPGDSGGSNVAWLGYWSPEGVTSGAQLYWDGARYRCGQVFGQPNVSWYFPIADSLAYYGAVYGVTTW